MSERRQLRHTTFEVDAAIDAVGAKANSMQGLVSLIPTDNPYLYEASFANYDKAKAMEYFSRTPSSGGCSAVRSGNFYGRNLDWTFDNAVDFVVKTPHIANRYATIGVTSCMASLTKEVVEEVCGGGAYAQDLEVVPWAIVDGINEHGVVCNINVVPNDKEDATPTIPKVSKKETIYATMVPRFVLDNFKTAEEAATYLRDYVEIKIYPKDQELGFENHFMIADKDKTFVVELVDKEVRLFEGQQIMTNFHIDGVTFNDDGTVYTNADAEEGHLPTEENGITEHGSGLERYNLAVRALEDGDLDKDGMRDLMTSLFYTNAYKTETNPFWYSEFVGIEETTVDTPADDETLTAVVNAAIGLYQETTREKGDTWHSTHSSVYDIAQRKLYLVAQEDEDIEYEFSFDYYTKEQVDELLRSIEDRLNAIGS